LPALQAALAVGGTGILHATCHSNSWRKGTAAATHAASAERANGVCLQFVYTPTSGRCRAWSRVAAFEAVPVLFEPVCAFAAGRTPSSPHSRGGIGCSSMCSSRRTVVSSIAMKAAGAQHGVCDSGCHRSTTCVIMALSPAAYFQN
jgi:hypothetical protein